MACSFIYFDLGNVLLSFCHDRMCSQLAEVAQLEPEEVRYALLEAEGAFDVQMQFERGDLSAAEYYDFFCQQTNTRPDRSALEHAGSDIFEPMEDSIRLLAKLSDRGHRVGLLSNVGSVHWGFVSQGRFPLIPSIFETLVLSYKVRSVKPEAGIYQQAITQAGVSPEEIFFVDDRHENVAAAIQAGIDAVHYKTPECLAMELQNRGVQVE